MAREITEIYDEMIVEKNNQSQLSSLVPNVDSGQQLLTDLSSTSKVATWRLFYWIVAVAIWTLEKLFDTHNAEIRNIVENNHYGNFDWYNKKAKEFQLGDDLIVEEGVVKYATTDLSKQIVKYSATVPGAVIQVKVAGLSGSELTRISNSSPDNQLDKIQDYFNKIKPFGTRVSVTSNDADKLKIIADIYYNPLLINSNGSSVGSSSRPVDDAIQAFLKSIEFNGKLKLQQLTDAIQTVSGVTDIANLEVWAKYGDNEYEQIVREYFSYAGWMSIDVDYNLETTLNYIADNV